MKRLSDFLRSPLFLLVWVGLSGCGGDNNVRDLRAYMNEVAARPQGRVQPLPEFKPYEPFKYLSLIHI